MITMYLDGEFHSKSTCLLPTAGTTLVIIHGISMEVEQEHTLVLVVLAAI